MPDLIRTPQGIKTMVDSVFMAQLQKSGISIDTPKMLWFKHLLIDELEAEIFGMLCEEERMAVKEYTKVKGSFIIEQILLWYQSKKDRDYKFSDNIRSWLMNVYNINPEENLEID